jgi:hypothetical protein
MPSANWSGAFRRQAKSDFEIYLRLHEAETPLCHQLHYLQMCVEKIAKSHYAAKPQASHYHAIEDMLSVIKRTPKLLRRYGFGSSRQFQQVVAKMQPMLDFLEQIVPQRDESRINAEYPWLQNGTVVAPCEFSFRGTIADDYRVAQLVWFLKRLVEE